MRLQKRFLAASLLFISTVGSITFYRLIVGFPTVRSMYREIPLADTPSTGQPANADRIRDLIYGASLSELDSIPELAIDTLSQTSQRWTIGVVDEFEGDDSIVAVRYRLEYVASGAQWQLVWVGSQAKCHSGRGIPFWPFYSSMTCS